MCPRTVEAGVEAVAVCRRHNLPLLSRGGGTSLAGETTNTAVVLDWSKYCHRLLEVDPESRTCLVEPGIVLDVLNERLHEAGLEFGPRPATHNHCTLGMIGNNSCGATAQRAGKVVDNGFSCRTQVEQSDAHGRTAVHLAELLRAGLPRTREPLISLNGGMPGGPRLPRRSSGWPRRRRSWRCWRRGSVPAPPVSPRCCAGEAAGEPSGRRATSRVKAAENVSFGSHRNGCVAQVVHPYGFRFQAEDGPRITRSVVGHEWHGE